MSSSLSFGVVGIESKREKPISEKQEARSKKETV